MICILRILEYNYHIILHHYLQLFKHSQHTNVIVDKEVTVDGNIVAGKNLNVDFHFPPSVQRQNFKLNQILV